MFCTIIWTKILTRPYHGSKNHFWRINCSVNSFCSLSTFCNASCWTRNLKKMYQWEMLVTSHRCHRLHHSSSSLSLLLFSSSSQSWTKSIEKTPHSCCTLVILMHNFSGTPNCLCGQINQVMWLIGLPKTTIYRLLFKLPNMKEITLAFQQEYNIIPII